MQQELLFSEEEKVVKPLTLSRSKIEQYMQCRRCFYLDIKLGIKQPPQVPFTLNNAVDTLFKKEFDYYRALQKPHPLFIEHNLLDVVPYKTEYIEAWRSNTKGIRYTHTQLNIELYGALDDVWINSKNELIVVDYKATGKKVAVTHLGDSGFHSSYRRQVEMYQWLLQRNGFTVSPTAYFVYASATSDKPMFNYKLDFAISLIPYVGKTYWIEKALVDVAQLLESSDVPMFTESCALCNYQKSIQCIDA
jgi:CRISPR/Cas system-associated exonuclease Cas4 (RecB family)